MQIKSFFTVLSFLPSFTLYIIPYFYPFVCSSSYFKLTTFLYQWHIVSHLSFTLSVIYLYMASKTPQKILTKLLVLHSFSTNHAVELKSSFFSLYDHAIFVLGVRIAPYAVIILPGSRNFPYFCFNWHTSFFVSWFILVQFSSFHSRRFWFFFIRCRYCFQFLH